MRARAFLFLGLLSTACTTVAGLDELVFDGTAGEGGSGTGGVSATSSSSTGGTSMGGGGAGPASGGELIWTRVFGGDLTSQLGGLAVRSDDAIVIAFDYRATVSLEEGPELTAVDGRDVALAVIDRSASLLLEAATYGGMGPQAFSGLAVDEADRIYVCLTFQNGLNIGPLTLASANSWDVGMAAMADATTPIWGAAYGSTEGQDCHDLGVAGGRLIVKGALDGSASFGGAEFDSQGSVDGWMGAYGVVDGAHEWSIGFGSSAAGIPERPLDRGRIDVAATGVAMAGGYHDKIDFGLGELTSTGAVEGFVTLHTLDGEPRLSLSISGLGNQWAQDVAIAEDGDLIVVGDFENAMTVAGTSLVAVDGRDGFVARIAPSGEVRWLVPIEGQGTQAAERVALGPDGAIFVAGTFRNTIDAPGGRSPPPTTSTPSSSATGSTASCNGDAPSEERAPSRPASS